MGLTADEEDRRTGELGAVERDTGISDRRPCRDVSRRRLDPETSCVDALGDGNPEQRSGSGSHGLRVVDVDGTGRHHNSDAPGRLGHAQKGPRVARVLEADEREDRTSVADSSVEDGVEWHRPLDTDCHDRTRRRQIQRSGEHARLHLADLHPDATTVLDHGVLSGIRLEVDSRQLDTCVEGLRQEDGAVDQVRAGLRADAAPTRQTPQVLDRRVGPAQSSGSS